MAVYPVSLPPHIRGTDSVSTRMWKKGAALLPALIALTVFSKFEIFKSLGVSIAAALLAEAATFAWLRKKSFFQDISGFVEALLFAVLISPELPYWMIFTAFFFAMMIGREIFGGLGSSPFSPALLAFAFLQITFPEVSAVSPLLPLPWVSAAVFSGGVFLIWQKLTPWQVPGLFLAAFALGRVLTGTSAAVIFSGEILFAAFFLITDNALLPLTKTGRIFFAAAAAAFMLILEKLGSGFDPLIFSILLASLLTPWLDQMKPPKAKANA